MDFYMLWVAGKGKPTKIYPTHDAALAGVKYLKTQGVTREIYILKPVEIVPGRKLLTLPKQLQTDLVEPKSEAKDGNHG